MLTITNRSNNAKTAQKIGVSDIAAYLDTVEIWFPLLRIEDYRKVARHGRLEECRTRYGRLIGCRLIRNQPSKAWLQQADQLARSYRGMLHRVDVALDMEPRPGLRELIVTTAVLKWAAKTGMHDNGCTMYWVYRKCSRRNLVLYDDRPNRITGELDCLHLELRLIGADIIRRQGFHKPSELLRLNPRQLFDKHVKWSEAGEAYVKTIMRKESDKQRKRYAGQQLSPWMDRFLGSFPKQVNYQLRRLGLNRSQNLGKEVRNRVESVLAIPAELEWRCGQVSKKVLALKSLSSSKKVYQSCCLSPG